MTDQRERIGEDTGADQAGTPAEAPEIPAAETPEAPEAAPTEKSQERQSALSYAYDMMGNLVTAFLLVTVVLCFFFRLVDVDGESMLNTLQNKDRLVLRTAFYTPERGDIVVLYQETAPDRPLIKRVIATGGDTLRLDVANNAVYLKKAGESEFRLLDEPYVQYPLAWGSSQGSGDITVPEGHVFVMGDHRNNSKDSRVLGSFPVEDVVGEAVFRLMPFDSIGTL